MINSYVEKAGLFKLDVVNLHYHFEPVVVEVPNDQQQTESGKKQLIRAYLYNLKSGKDQRLAYPLQLEPSLKVQYFEIEQPFNPL